MLTWEAKKEAIFEMPVRGRGEREGARAKISRALKRRDDEEAKIGDARRDRGRETATDVMKRVFCIRRPVVPRSCARARTC